MSYKSPTEQANTYASAALKWWKNPRVGGNLRELLPKFSDAPPAVLTIAFYAPANYTDDTAESKPGTGWRRADGSWQDKAFHEIGFGQVVAGWVTSEKRGDEWVLTSRSPTGGDMDTWSKLAGDTEVVAALGRRAVTGAGEWRKRDRRGLSLSMPDQNAVTIAMLRDDYRSARSKLSEKLRPTSSVTQWGAFVMFASFSAGPSKAAAMCSRWETDLASRSEGDRAGRLIECICRDYASGAWVPTSKASHGGNLAHTAARTWQKLALAERLAATIGQPVAQWQLTVRDRAVAERVLVAAATRARVSDADKAVVLTW